MPYSRAASEACARGLPVSVTTAAAKKATKSVECMGINACKGQSACKSASNACKGQNSCKGQGFKELTQKDCDAAKAQAGK